MAKGVVQILELHEALVMQEARFVEQDDHGSETDSEQALVGRSSGSRSFSRCYECGSLAIVSETVWSICTELHEKETR